MTTPRIPSLAVAALALLLVAGLALAHNPLDLHGEPESASPTPQQTATPGPASIATTGTTSSGGPNGYVMMVHGAADPNPNSVSPVFVPPGHEAVMATLQGEEIQLHAIPYEVENGTPVEVLFPELELINTATGDRAMYQPNAPAEESAICEEETGFAGHEGPIEACLVFHIPAHELSGWNVVTMRLHFANETGISFTEPYNVASHYLLHASIEGEDPSLRAEADNRTHPTPFLIQDQIDLGLE